MDNSSSTTPSDTRSDSVARVSWLVDLGHGSVTWDWALGPIPVRSLHPIRGPRSTAKSRHIPVRAHCVTTGDELRLESGLEHDLLRDLDRLSSVVWVVAQPFRLTMTPGVGARRRSLWHVPDLVSLSENGVVTAWDVRPSERQDERFVESVEWTRAACQERGWRHEVFGGHSSTKRSNLMWLHGFRHDEPWQTTAEAELRSKYVSEGFVLADLAAQARASYMVATVWHLIWCGKIQVDLNAPLTGATLLRWTV